METRIQHIAAELRSGRLKNRFKQKKTSTTVFAFLSSVKSKERNEEDFSNPYKYGKRSSLK